MELKSIKAMLRETKGKGAARKVRAQGTLPAVLYGGDASPVSLALNRHQFEILVHGKGGEHALVQIEVAENAGLSSPALVKAVQHHPVRGTIIHADFLRIRLDERIHTSVPVRLAGQPVGVIDGGVLDHQLREVDIECLAIEVPDELVLDVSEMRMGDSAHVSRLVAPPGVTILTDPERSVAAVHVPRVVKEAVAEGEAVEAAPAAEGETAEPEVISEKKAKEREKDRDKEK